MRALQPLRGHRVQIALPHQDVRDPADLDLGPVLRVVEHPVTGLHGPYVLPDRDHLGPGQPSADGRGGGDDDSAGRPALALRNVGADQHAVVQHPDGQLVMGRVRTHAMTVPGRRAG
ncbi:hypothetical protein SVIO_046440 [Streptomyces violaceusniger]|uniref:Uncharacterized protein n=1 Tax=Streptomyces violaceusniger TaxID=68280 RepID=A0A4D4KXJ3_STRVO|nr:hypothetical protein SVIO_046440 [Streptomyces violaceusniger]